MSGLSLVAPVALTTVADPGSLRSTKRCDAFLDLAGTVRRAEADGFGFFERDFAGIAVSLRVAGKTAGMTRAVFYRTLRGRIYRAGQDDSLRKWLSGRSKPGVLFRTRPGLISGIC
jgi:hypothetical protein